MPTGNVKASVNGTTVAESDTYEFVEGNVYFPPAAIKTEYFTKTDHHTHCPWKGDASYYTVKVNGMWRGPKNQLPPSYSPPFPKFPRIPPILLSYDRGGAWWEDAISGASRLIRRPCRCRTRERCLVLPRD